MSDQAPSNNGYDPPLTKWQKRVFWGQVGVGVIVMAVAPFVSFELDSNDLLTIVLVAGGTMIGSGLASLFIRAETPKNAENGSTHA